MRSWFAAVAMLAGLAPAALAGGVHAKIEGPGPDGTTYTVRTYSCNATDQFDPWAHAEGMVDGKRQSVLLRLHPAGAPGVYQFSRAWPQEGRWMIRLNLGHPPAPATVTTLRADGSVKRNQLFFRTDGSPECSRALNPKAEPGC